MKIIPTIEVVLNIPIGSRMIFARFYNPVGQGDWYVMGASKVNGDWLFYGVIVFTKIRFDYFSIKELKNKSLPFGLKILRDESFEAILWSDLHKTIENS